MIGKVRESKESKEEIEAEGEVERECGGGEVKEEGEREKYRKNYLVCKHN